MRSPQHLLEAWADVERRIRRSGRVVLFTDFDGTLVPIARTPEDVRLPPAVRRLLSLLGRKGVLVGVASGRALSDLRARVGLRRVCYVGSHGYSYYRPGHGPRSLLEPKQLSAMAEVHQMLAQKFRGLGGIRLKPKEGTVAVHYRDASRRMAAAAEAVIREVLATRPRLHLLSGKKVWELLPEARVSKWTAIQRLLREEPRTGPLLLFYIGDDATDERVFEQMTGISVAVGRRRRTVAQYFLRSPDEVRRFLERLRDVVK